MARQADHAGFRCTVTGEANIAQQARGGPGIDDGAAARLQERGNGVLHAQPHALQVDGDLAIELLFLEIEDIRPGDADAGIVEQDVEAAALLDGLLHQGRHIRRAAHVGAHIEAALAHLLFNARAVGVIDIGDDHARALPGEQLGRCLAHARCAARHDRHLAIQSAHCASPWLKVRRV